jgi:hypothetical protein
MSLILAIILGFIVGMVLGLAFIVYLDGRCVRDLW